MKTIRMLKLNFLFAFTLSFSAFSQSENVSVCSYCTSLEDALVKPEEVVHLDLHAQGLRTLPARLEEFVNLKSLDLSENLIDEIDFEKYSWLSLEKLDLSDNPGINTVELEGIGKVMPNLKSLDLSNCSALVLSPAISELRELQNLDLSDNSFVFIPTELEKLKKLKTLKVNDNKLTSADFIAVLWNLNYLDISGNEKLDLREVATALYFKPTFSELIISPTYYKFGLPKSFSEVSMKHLTIKDGEINQLETRLAGCKELKKITLDNISVDDAKRFSRSVNQLSQVETLEFKNMIVPEMIDQISGVKNMEFEYCEFENLEELKKVKPSINMSAIGTNIENGDYIGNSKVAKMGERNKVEQRSEPIRVSEAMLNNEVEPIVVPETQKMKVLGDTPCVVKTKSSEIEIPEKAFLSANGEVYTGEVELKVIEYMDPVVNALAGTPMMFQTGRGTEVFASSGMMDFRAYDSKGNELQPNPESIIQVQMNDLQPAETSNFYTYDEAKNNWDVAPIPRPSDFMEKKQRVLDSLNLLSAEEVTGFKVVPIGMFMKFKKSRKDPYKLTFSSRGKSKRLKRIRGEAQTTYTSNPEQRWMAKRKTWKIDTLISDEMLDLLTSIKKDQRKTSKHWHAKAAPRYEFAPRVIRDLTIEPNLEQDNYSMTFAYRDSNYRIPVILSLSGSISRIQAKEKRYFQQFQKEQRIGDKERKVIDNYKAKELKKYAEIRRYMLSMTPQLNFNDDQANKEYIRFGLTSFGLTNCDYFFRNVPDGYIAFDSTGVDEDGNIVQVPRDVRSIFLDDNAYVSTTSIDVPVYEKRRSIVLFLITAVEIGIVKGWEVLSNGFARPKVERISIEGLTPDEVSKKILKAGS